MSADIILYALVAAGLVFWLRNILGTRHEDEPQRPNPFTSQAENKNNVPVSADLSSAQPNIVDDSSGDSVGSLSTNQDILIKEGSAESGLVEIARHDRNFDLSFFMQGAQDVFIMIVEAFAAGERETLQDFLSPGLYKAFSTALDQRESDGQKANVEIHAIRRSEIIDAYLKDRTAFITVKFTADETNVLRDKDDKLISGHPDRVTETVDIWTFGRDVKSRNPAWILYETRDEDAAGEDHKTVPDSQ